jgi:hypothetical protein
VKESLENVWQNEAYTQYRRNYLAGKVSGTLCEGCKVQEEADFKFKPSLSILGLLSGQPYPYEPIPPPSSPPLELAKKPLPVITD